MMDPNLQYLKNFVKNDALNQCLSFSLEEGKLIADLIHFKMGDFLDIKDTYYLYTDGHSFLVFFYPESVLLSDQEGAAPVYYQFDKFEDFSEVVSDLFKWDDDLCVPGMNASVWNGTLPAWALLVPRYIHEDHIHLFKNPLLDAIETSGNREMLSKTEKKITRRWLDFQKNEAGLYYGYVGGV